eukprot:jgi/Bigna1/82024/fgenesh1_pg.87_\
MSKTNPGSKKSFESKTSGHVKECCKKNSQKWLRKVECEACNCMIGSASLSRHKRTEKHMLNGDPNPSEEQKKFVDDDEHVKFGKCKSVKLKEKLDFVMKKLEELGNKTQQIWFTVLFFFFNVWFSKTKFNQCVSILSLMIVNTFIEMVQIFTFEKNDLNSINICFPLTREDGEGNKDPSKVNVDHLLWMINDKDTVGGKGTVVVRKTETKAISPMTRNTLHSSNVQTSLNILARNKGHDVGNPTEDPRKPRPPMPPGGPAPGGPAPGGPAPGGPAPGGPAPGGPAPGNGQQQMAQEAKLPALARSNDVDGRETQATPSQRFNQQPGFGLTPVVPATAPAGFESTPDDMGEKKLTDSSLKEIKECNDFQRPLPEILERQNAIHQTKTRQGLIDEATHPFGGEHNATNESQINCDANSKNPFVKSQARSKVKEVDDTSEICRPQLQEAIDDAKPSAKLLAKMANVKALKVEVPVEPPFKARGFDPKELRPAFKINHTHGAVPHHMSQACKKKKDEVADVCTACIKSKQMKDANVKPTLKNESEQMHNNCGLIPSFPDRCSFIAPTGSVMKSKTLKDLFFAGGKCGTCVWITSQCHKTVQPDVRTNAEHLIVFSRQPSSESKKTAEETSMGKRTKKKIAEMFDEMSTVDCSFSHHDREQPTSERIPTEKATKPTNKGTKKGANCLKDEPTHPVTTMNEAEGALNKLDSMSHGGLGVVHQGAQVVFPQFGLAVALATVADEMAHNDGKSSKKTLKNISLNQATGGVHGDHQSVRDIEKSELVSEVENKFNADLHDLPDPDRAIPVSVEGSASVDDATTKLG